MRICQDGENPEHSGKEGSQRDTGRETEPCSRAEEEIRYCQRLSCGAGLADSVTKANLVSG